MSGSAGPKERASGAGVACLRPFLRRYRTGLGTVLGLIAGASLLALGPWVILAVMVTHVEAGTLTADLAMWLAIAAGAIVVARFLALAGGSALAHLVAFDVLRELRFALLGRMETAPMPVVTGEGRGALIKIVRDDVERLERLLAHAFPDLVAAVVPGLFAVVLLAVLDVRFALIAIAPLVASLVLVRLSLWNKDNAGLVERLGVLHERVSARLIELVKGQPVLRMFGSPWDLKKAGPNKADSMKEGPASESPSPPERLVEEVHEFELAWARKGLWPYGLSQAILGGTAFLAVGLGYWLVRDGGAQVSDFVLLVCLAPALVAPLEKVQHTIHEIVEMGQGVRRIAAILDWPAPGREIAVSSGPPCTHPVRFEALSCQIDGHTLLQDLSFEIPAAGMTAVVGASGAGKTTLVRVLARLIEPADGRILVGGRSLHEIPHDDWYRFAAFAFQGTFLSRDTVADNLRVARPEATDEELRKALWAACCMEVVEALPQGLETQLGGEGVALSGGQRQRLGLARALLRDAPLLVLDEATSHADPALEQVLIRRLGTYRAGRATLFVTHRLPSAALADSILVLEAGILRGQGRHGALMEGCPAYQRLSETRRAAA